MRTSEALFVIVYGANPVEGVLVELFIAIDLVNPTFFIDDFRKSIDSEKYPLN